MNEPRWNPLNSGTRRVAALGLLGVETWALVVVLPLVRVSLAEAGAGLLTCAVAPLGFLVLGMLSSAPSTRIGAWLVGFPVALAAAVGAQPDLTDRDAYGPTSIALIGLSLAAFLALALTDVSTPEQLRAASAQPLPAEVHHRSSPAFRTGRWVLALMGLAALGAIALAFWGGRAEALLHFGAAADDAVTLAVVVGTLLFGIAIGAVVGPGLRARKRTDVRRERLLPRVAPYLTVALLALVLRGVLFFFDAR